MKSLFCCISLLLFTNCATIFFGKKEYIQIKTNVANPTIKINDVVVPKANDTLERLAFYLSKRIESPTLELSAPGYQQIKFEFTRTPLKLYRHLGRTVGIIVGLSIVSGVSSETGYYNPLTALGVLGILGIPVGTSYLVDRKTQASNTFSFKQIELNLLKTQKPPLNNTINLSCSSFSLALKTNDVIGHTFETKHRAFNYKSEILWRNDAFVQANGLIEKTNTSLKTLGYLGGNDSLSKSIIVLKGNLMTLEYDEFIHDNILSASSANPVKEDVVYDSSIDRNLVTNITWTLYNTQTNQIVFEKNIRSQCWDDKQGFQNAASKNILQSIRLLLEEEGIQSIIQKGN